MMDLRFALRMLRRRPAATAVLVITFAVGIGASTAVFGVIDALLFSAAPFPDPDRLVVVSTVRGGAPGKLAPIEVDDLARATTAFEGLSTFRLTQYNVSGDGRPEASVATMSTYNLFEVLGVKPIYGETWPKSIDRTTSWLVAVSHDFWQRRLGGDPGAVGKSVTLDSYPYQVIAVLPPGFNFPTDTHIFRRVPPGDYDSRTIRNAGVVGRLAPGVTLAVAQAQLDAAAARLAADFPESNTGVGFRVRPLRTLWLGDAAATLGLLGGAVIIVLLCACANVASLLLASGLARRRELAVRTALGAPRGRIVRQLVTETLVVALLGGLLGLALAAATSSLVLGLVPVDLPPWMQPRLDGRVIAAAAGLTALAALVAGVWPALRATRVDIHDDLRRASTTRARRAIVALQIALGFALTASAGLLASEYLRLERRDLGLESGGLLTFKVDPPWSKFKQVEQTAPLYERLQRELEAIPGVLAVGSNDGLPFRTRDPAEAANRQHLRLEGLTADEEAARPYVSLQLVSPSYLAAAGVPVVEGRGFDVRDRMGAPPVALVSRAAARALWPGQPAIGKRLALRVLEANYRPLNREEAPPEQWTTVVGVVGDVQAATPEGGPGLDVYLSDQQRFSPETYFVLRAGVRPESLIDEARAAVARIDPELAVFDVASLRDRITATVWERRASGAVVSGFAIVALLLGAIGAHGVTSHGVLLRRREIGVRLALGASPGRIARMLFAEVGLQALAGLAFGALLLVAVAGALPAALDPGVIAVAAAVVGGAALLAGLIPALRASRHPPLAALRVDP